MVKSMEAQAAERDLPVPVDETVGQLRDLGSDVSDKPSPRNTLEFDASASHSWVTWVTRVNAHIYHLALLDGIADEAFASDPELAARRHVYDELREVLIVMLTETAEKVRNEKLVAVARYYETLATFLLGLRR